ncbi:large ribosomal subunit protein uL22m-like [Haliotis cracherodii]|uniref:large ribosomal subunit protein uL22m-like n=1 Tax=Haliotis cracherodii TaxID=6455 RepID=UPI0039E90191
MIILFIGDTTLRKSRATCKMASISMPCLRFLRASNHTVFRQFIPTLYQASSIYTCNAISTAYKNTDFDKSLGFRRKSWKWEKYNRIVYPPQKEGQNIRPAEICHARFQIKYSPLKMWYIAVMIRGMSIDEALKQLSFYKRKGAAVVKEVLEEAQEMAVRDHNVEYKSNLWIASSFVGQGKTVRGLRKHRGPRYGMIHYRYCNVFIRLQEGPPPKHYYPPPPTGHDKMEEFIRDQRARRIIHSL